MELDFSELDFVVEADSFAYHTLAMELIRKYGNLAVQGNPGHTFNVGVLQQKVVPLTPGEDELGSGILERPVVVTFWTYKIGNVNIAFLDAHSMLVDWDMINAWLAERYEGPKANADNWHQCLHVIEDKLRAGTTA
jgi:hypothetical protein